MYGVIAQLGERLNGIQEVSGSIPLSSTNSKNRPKGRFFCYANQRLYKPVKVEWAIACAFTMLSTSFGELCSKPFNLSTLRA